MEHQATYKRKSEPIKFNDSSIGKLPPQAIELEEVVLGSILCENGAFSRSSVLITSDVFYKTSHATIYNSCKDLYDKSSPIDIMTVQHNLELKGELEKCGGMMYLAELTHKINSSANLEHHCFILKEKFAKRQLLEMASNIQRLAFEDTEDIFETIDFVNDQFTEISDTLIINQEKTIQNQFAQMLSDIEKAKTNNGIIGVPSKFTDIQNKLKGYRKGNLIILGARPSMGKSLWMINEAVFQCQVGYKVAIFSMEMDASEQLARLVSSLTEISTNKIETGDVSIQDFERIHKSISQFPLNNLSIFEKSKMNLRYIKSCIQTLKRKGMIDIAYVDHLGLIKPERLNLNRNDALGEITSDLKAFAKDMQIPIVLLSQLNRGVENRADKKPILMDIRESGNIEQDANVCMFLHREDYYLNTPEKVAEYEDSIKNNPAAINMMGKGEISIAKNRSGKLGSAIFKFEGDIATMDNLYVDYQEVNNSELAQTHNFATNKALSEVGGVDSFLGVNDKSVPF